MTPRRHRLPGLLLALALLAGGPAVAYEEPAHETLMREGEFELRRYPGYLVAEVVVEGSFENAGGRAFRVLAGYIGGANRSRAEIAMTAPVTQEPEGETIAMTAPVTQEAADGRYRIAFVMPAEYTLETLPEPEDERVSLRAVPGRTVAVVRYSGFWSRARYDTNRARLEDWMAERSLEPRGDPIWARYDAPFKPWFLRRNEVQIPTRLPD